MSMERFTVSLERVFHGPMDLLLHLVREQEVEISKRIEEAENEVKRIIYSFGFTGKEHIALAEKPKL